MSLYLVPLTRKQAQEACKRWHRHNSPPVGDLFRVGCAKEGELVAVGIASRPVARHYDDGQTVEVTRVASDGTFNATSMLYGALARAAYALGYTRVITYTQGDESGASLRGAGWKLIGSRKPRAGWSTMSRPRDDAKYYVSERLLWEAQ